MLSYLNEDHIDNRLESDKTRTLLTKRHICEMSRKAAFVGGIENINKTNFPGIYDYYRRYKDWSHNQMAEHYRDAIIKGLKEFDNNQHSNLLYDDLAWRGLQNTRSWDEQVSASDRSRIKQSYKNLLHESGSKRRN